MKHLFAILVVLIPACRFSLACGPFDRLCTPDQYYTFRLCGADMTGNDLRDSRTGQLPQLGKTHVNRYPLGRHPRCRISLGI